MAGKGEYGLGELYIGFSQCIWAETGEVGQVVIPELEAVGIGSLYTLDDRFGARILHALIQPKSCQIALLIECFDGLALFLAGECSA